MSKRNKKPSVTMKEEVETATEAAAAIVVVAPPTIQPGDSQFNRFIQSVQERKKIAVIVSDDDGAKLWTVQLQHGAPELQGDKVFSKHFIDSVITPPIHCGPGLRYNAVTRECEPIIATEMRVVSVTGTEIDRANGLANAIDKKSDTRWSAKGHGSFIVLDMGMMRDVGALQVLWFLSEKRSYMFDLEVSSDNVTWVNIEKGRMSTISEQPDTYDLKRSNCRFIKITGYGNNNRDGTINNEWISIVDMVVLSKYELIAGERVVEQTT
jgi:hypothetical protein